MVLLCLCSLPQRLHHLRYHFLHLLCRHSSHSRRFDKVGVGNVPSFSVHRGAGLAVDAQEQKLRESFSRNPALQAVYEFGQELCELLRIRRQNKEQCRELVARLLAYIDELCRSPFKPMSSLGRTLDSWKEEIARMFRFSKNNGITEGFHRKMKLIHRRAYGFLNFENYRLSVRVLCG